MTKFFNENDYENIIIEIFQNMGYNHIYGPSIEKRDFNLPIYEEELINALYRLNPSLPDEAINDALFKLKNFENAELVQKKCCFYGLYSTRNRSKISF